MTIQETNLFLKRIKQHYQDFIIDNSKVDEWYRELKDYDYVEVNNKLDDHLRNEQYGHQIPKVAFLTKYLTKISEKSKNNANNIRVRCHLCGAGMPLTEYGKHIERCNSVEYLNQQCLRLKDREIDKEKYRSMDYKSFNSIYDKVLEEILKITTDEEERTNITNYFLGTGQ